MRLPLKIVLGMILFSVFAESGFTVTRSGWATRSDDGDEIGKLIGNFMVMDA